MVDLEKYIISLKLSWMNRIVKCEKTDYQRLFEKNITSIHKLLKLATDWPKHLIQKTRNTFWNEVFMSWIKFSENIDIKITMTSYPPPYGIIHWFQKIFFIFQSGFKEEY